MNSKPASRINELINQFESREIKLKDRLKIIKKALKEPITYQDLAWAHEALINLKKEYPEDSRVNSLLLKVNKELKS